ncbi:MAG: hypothetical protein JRI23_11325, partial [Deltaproteobacteria bacterium]|nr:hypothetical protein [Deltaproteobacteria bacterium]MBW2532288.1 hypothetical protein [Deltaproteobacteria bacterium]
TERCTEADVVWVSKTGTDSGSCGADGDECLTIKHALGLASAGDAVCVRTGTYEENWVAVPSGVRLISADGDQAAVIDSGTQSAVRFDGVDGATLEGFEVYGDWDQGSPGDGLIRVVDATDITVYRVVAHDAPYDQDVIKVSGQVSGLVLDTIVAYNPAHRTDGNWQENIDIFGSGATGSDPPPVSGAIVRNCWLFHTAQGGDFLLYSKIYVERILYENNVFGPSAGGGFGNVAVGVGTGEPGIPDATAAVIVDAIVRNNVFVGLKGDAALGVFNSENVWVYNNTFYANSGADLRSVIMLRGNSHQVGATYVMNNLFVDNQPSLSGGSFYWVRQDGLPTTWEHHHNLYDGNIATTDTPYTGETGSLYDTDPLLAAPAIPATASHALSRIDEIKATFAIGTGSPAVGAGVDAVGESGHPNWDPGATDRRWDYRGQARSSGGPWDLGADEQ